MKIDRAKLRNTILGNSDLFRRNPENKNFEALIGDIQVQLSSSGNLLLVYHGVKKYVEGFKNVYELLYAQKKDRIKEFAGFDDE